MKSSYMSRQVTCTATVAWICWIYSLIGHSPAVSSASDTGRHSHSPLVVHRNVIPVILLDTWWWNPSSTFILAFVTTHISLPYYNTDRKTAFYRTPRAHNFAPVFVITFLTINHCRHGFWRFWYRASQSLLLYATVQPRYGRAATISRGSVFTLINTWLTLKQCCRVAHLIWRPSRVIPDPDENLISVSTN